MNDQHITAVATIFQAGILLVSAILILWYLVETRRMRIAAERQVEASFRPALIVTHDGSRTSLPQLHNIGLGPAMEVTWTARSSKLGHKFPYLLPNQKQPLCDVSALFDVGAFNVASEIGPEDGTVVIECNYRSLSGKRYASMSTLDLNTIQFTTAFRDS
jgi:hypothetical protein